MDLLTFTEGIQSVHLQESDVAKVHSSESKRFVPLGDSVIRHTEALFSTQHAGQNILKSLIEPTHRTSFDPSDYDMQASATYEFLVDFKHQLALQTEKKTIYSMNQMAPKPQLTMETLQQALTVLNSLQKDRQLLRMNQVALEKV